MNQTSPGIIGELAFPGFSSKMLDNFCGLHNSGGTDRVPASNQSPAHIYRKLALGPDRAVINQVSALSFFTKKAVFISHNLGASESIMKLSQVNLFQRVFNASHLVGFFAGFPTAVKLGNALPIAGEDPVKRRAQASNPDGRFFQAHFPNLFGTCQNYTGSALSVKAIIQPFERVNNLGRIKHIFNGDFHSGLGIRVF